MREKKLPADTSSDTYPPTAPRRGLTSTPVDNIAQISAKVNSSWSRLYFPQKKQRYSKSSIKKIILSLPKLIWQSMRKMPGSSLNMTSTFLVIPVFFSSPPSFPCTFSFLCHSSAWPGKLWMSGSQAQC